MSKKRRIWGNSSFAKPVGTANPEHLVYGIIACNVGVYAAWQWAAQTNDRRLHRFLEENLLVSAYNVFHQARWHVCVRVRCARVDH